VPSAVRFVNMKEIFDTQNEFKIVNWFCASELVFDYTFFELSFQLLEDGKIEIYLPNGNYYDTI